jgi:cytochrome c2
MRPRLMFVLLPSLILPSCDLFEGTSFQPKYVSGGDPAVGRAILVAGTHGCKACHFIPGVGSPRGVAGPPLAGFARRAFIAGQLPNRPEMLIAFLEDPPSLIPSTGMPNVGLLSEEARHIAAYLYSLERPDAR